ncbi:MAG: DEAD/DEAH box helicase [Clostridia bacterium]|nr:DEAD/DEAH box helicase [Clostridia bacterium]
MEINNLNISDEIKRALLDMGYEEFMPIQEQAIPICLEGKDIIGRSHTGTGKTAAFAIPILQKIDPNNHQPQAIILCPTRELAVQVAGEFKKIAKYMHDVRSVAVYGGEPINRQIMTLKRGAQVIIGTPGRTIDHIIKRHTIKTGSIHTVVLDEADEMLKMGFREDIELILETIPKDRQTLLFSATMPKAIMDITKKYQNSPEIVEIKSDVKTADSIKQEYCETKSSHKVEALIRLLNINNPTRCMVFCNMKSTVDDVNDALNARGIASEKIHGDLTQMLRMSVLRKFNDAIISVLVATDVAARGLDIKEVDLIINYDIPDKEEYYVHRVGRSGRAGNDGHAITIVGTGAMKNLINVMHYTKKNIEKIKIPTMKQVNTAKAEAFIQEITETIQNENLEDYKDILNQVDTMYTIEDICASLIKKSLELEEITHENDINYMGKPQNSFTNAPKSKSSGSQKKKNFKTDKDMVRVFITIGNMDKIKPKNILGAIIGECDIPSEHVGSIDVLDKFTFVDIHKDSSGKVLKKLDGKKINGKKVSLEIAKASRR